jgi:arginine N-succinyltransferase
MLLLRDAQRHDLAALRALAAELNSVNLPDDARALAAIVERSRRSFAGRIRAPLERSYVFVLEEPRSGRVLGTSMLIAQHGTRESPCTFFDVAQREHYSSTLDRHFRHAVLSIGYHFDGPTEIGGLVVHPRDRGGEERPGKQLAYVRLLFVAMHRQRFRDRLLAELMPPLLPDGRSLFWEACGKRFTGLEYQEADRRSRENKEFIQQLFPPGGLYVTLFPRRVQRALGAVGPATRGVRHLLERVGFRPVHRIDPFDGGPHYEAAVDDVTLVRAHRRLRLARRDLTAPGPARSAPRRSGTAADGSPGSAGRCAGQPGDGEEILAAVERPDGRIRFRAVRTAARVEGDELVLPREARDLLLAAPGDRIDCVPFD